MDWTTALGDVLQKYTGQGAGTAAAPEDPHQDFQKVAQSAPQDVVANGISHAFRSDQTPPFPEMLAGLFSHSGPSERAGLLNSLLGSVGSGAVSMVPSLGGLSSLLGGGKVTPEQASHVSPEQVQQLATHAERQNPSVVDEISGFFSQHPELMKAVGGLAVTIALQHMLKHR